MLEPPSVHGGGSDGGSGGLVAAGLQWVWHHALFHVQRVALLASFTNRLLLLGAVSLAHVAVGALLYRMASGESWGCALFKVYGVLFRAPGFAVTTEASLAAAVVLNALFIFSIFVFAVLLGMISDEIKHRIQAVRSGEMELRLRGHCLVLYWSDALGLSLLRQLYHAQRDPKHALYRRPVVLLADRDRAELEAAVAGTKALQGFELFVRSGRPDRPPDLQRVAAASAAIVLLLQPEPCTSEAAAEALKATTLIGLRCLQLSAQGAAAAGGGGGGGSAAPQDGGGALVGLARRAGSLVESCIDAMAWGPAAAGHHGASCLEAAAQQLQLQHAPQQLRSAAMRIVVQVPNHNIQGDDPVGFLHSTTASISNVQGARLLSQRMLDRLVSQTALQPGVAQAFREIVRAGADAAQLCWCAVDGAIAGTYKSARTLFPHAIVLGVLTGGQLQLNPPDDSRVEEGDRLLGFTRQASMVLSPPSDAAGGGGWRRLTRSLSRSNSMSSRLLHVVPSSAAFTADSAPQFRGPGPGRAVHVIVLGWAPASVPQLLASLQEGAPPGSCVTVVHISGAEGAGGGSPGHSPGRQGRRQQHEQQQQEEQQQAGGFTCRHLYAQEPGSVSALLAAGVADADAVIIGGALAQAPGSAEADAMVVAALLAVHQALGGGAAPPQSGGGAGQGGGSTGGGCAPPPQGEVPQQATGLLRRRRAPQQPGQPLDAARGSAAAPPAAAAGASWGWQARSSAGGGPAAAAAAAAAAARQSEASSIRLHVVAVLSSHSVRRSAQVFLGAMAGRSFSYEVLVLEEYAGAMLVQVAHDPATSLVMQQLLAPPGGSALYMWPAGVLGFRDGQTTTFGQVCKAARRNKTTAIGYRRANGRMLLAPSAVDVLRFEEGDRLVVIADALPAAAPAAAAGHG